MEIDQKLRVHAVATVLAGPQIFSMTPVDGRDEGAVDQADPAGDQHGQVGVVGGATRIGEGHHQLIVIPRGCRFDTEILVEILVGGVASQLAQRQPQRGQDRQRPGTTRRPIPAGEMLHGGLDHERGRSTTQPRQPVH